MSQSPSGVELALQFVDNRPEALAQKSFQALSNGSVQHGPVAQLKAMAGGVIQRRPLNHSERDQLAEARMRIKKLGVEYDQDKSDIQDALKIKNTYNDSLEYLHKINFDHIHDEITKVDEFFVDIEAVSRQANSSEKSLDKLIVKLNGYEFSGGRNAIKNARNEVDRKLKSEERDNLTQITDMDEKFFSEYLKKSKSAMTVYRGDGRGVSADFLEHYVRGDVLAGGTEDISFYGVVQHTHSSTDKNGMVSTTTDKDQAFHWAVDDHNYGVVYEFQLTEYLHVENLLARRKFKNRFAAQKEILVPGNISASDIVSVSLYKKDVLVDKTSF